MAPTKTRRRTRKTMCQGVRTKPNRCKKITSCKVARGTKRTFCRRKRNRNTRKK